MTTKTKAYQWTEAPALEIDAAIANIRRDGRPPLTAEDAARQLHARSRVERFVAWNLVHYLSLRDFNVIATFDGDAREQPATIKAALELIFNLDEVSVRFRKIGTRPDGKRWPEHGVLLVLGNDGWDLVSDWNYTEGDADGFNATMDAFGDALEAERERDSRGL
jgi:hypothetical protein